MTIKIATAECFTHGLVAREIHACTQGYQGEFGPQLWCPETIKNFQEEVMLLCGLFIPTLTALKTVLKVDPPEPHRLINGIKVYQQKEDQEVAVLMARAVKDLTGADVGIGTTAGIGKGGIALLTDQYVVKTTSDVYADLCSADSQKLLLRQRSGVKKTLGILEEIIGK
ncbi:UPF0254 family protein [Methanobacterium formicicum]|uniref:UPF0254 family protein n=1 Tax=Methanobacterium formicicum TaxID=2162 RepID=UPI002492B5ED|nr:UPF0254 family protein [Methanobacterium formicicum]